MLDRRRFLMGASAVAVGSLTNLAWAQANGPDPLLLDKLLQRDLVFLGEQHDNATHHAKQAQMVAWLRERHPGQVGVAMEMVQIPFQSELDAFIAGEFPLSELPERLEWKKRWGFDFKMYAPVFEYCRKWSMPMRAMRFSNESSKLLGSHGTSILSADEALGMDDVDPTNLGGDQQRLAEIMHGHGESTPEEKRSNLERFIRVQVLWEEGMISQALALRERVAKVAVLVGAGHLTIGHGLQGRATRRCPGTNITSSVVLFSGSEAERRRADLVWEGA